MKLKTPWDIIRFSICITSSVAGPEPFRVEIFWLEPVRWFSNQRKMEKNCKKTKNMFLMLIIQVFTNTFIFIYFLSEYSVQAALRVAYLLFTEGFLWYSLQIRCRLGVLTWQGPAAARRSLTATTASSKFLLPVKNFLTSTDISLARFFPFTFLPYFLTFG